MMYRGVEIFLEAGKNPVDSSIMEKGSVHQDQEVAIMIILLFLIMRERFVSIRRNVLTNRIAYFSILKARVELISCSRNVDLQRFVGLKRVE